MKFILILQKEFVVVAVSSIRLLSFFFVTKSLCPDRTIKARSQHIKLILGVRQPS
jgi:hypothetical protein